jgi:hypothetical protein
MPSALALLEVTFVQLGNVLSFLSSGAMFYVIMSDRKARNQTRPRLLAVLAFLDSVTALSKFIAFLPGMTSAGKLLFEIALGDIVGVASWSWTCCIALHIFLVLRQNIQPNSVEEQNLEWKYWVFIFVSSICTYAPCTIAFLYVDENSNNWEKVETKSFRKYAIMQLVYTLLQYAWIVGAVIAINCCTTNNSNASQNYKRQTSWYLFAFIVLTVQALLWMLQVRELWLGVPECVRSQTITYAGIQSYSII